MGQPKPQTRSARRYGALLRQLMEQQGLSQVAVAKVLGISQAYVSSLISGERRGIGAELVDLATEKLNLDPMYFFDPYPGEVDHKEYLRTDKNPLLERLGRLERLVQNSLPSPAATAVVRPLKRHK